MTTPPIPEITDVPDAPVTEEPPEPQRYVETVAVAEDTEYGVRLSGFDGQPVDSGDVLRGDLVIATLHLAAEGGWWARLATEGLPADVTYVGDTPQNAAVFAAMMYSALTGDPYGAPLGAADSDETRQRVNVLRANLSDLAARHRDAVASAAARAYPAGFEQNENVRALTGSLNTLAAAVSESHGSRQMTQHLDAVQRAAGAWGGSLPADPDHPERSQLAFPLAHLLYNSRRLKAQVQATLAAVQAERAAARDQAAAVTPGPAARATPAAPVSTAAAAAGTEQVTTEPGSPEVPDSRSAAQELPVGALAREGEDPAVSTVVDGVRRALEEALQASQPESAAQPSSELPLWTGPQAVPVDTAAAEPATGPVDLRAEFQAVMDAWTEHMPPENGTAQDLVAALDADLATLQRAFTETITPPTPAAPPSPVRADTPAEPTAGRATVSVSQQADAVNAALLRTDAHAASLQDLPEWQKIQTVRGAVGHLVRVMKERAGQHFDRLMGDGRVGDFVRRISLRTCEKIAGWALAAADRLRRTGDSEAEGRALPSTDALLQLGDATREYSGHRHGAAPPPPRPANDAAPNTVDIPVMRKLGEALNRPMPGTTKRVSSAAARGRSTTAKARAPKPAPRFDEAGHLRRSATDPQQPRKPHQR